jgi:hypothetical protein
MGAVHFIYNDQPVDFLPTGKDNVMVNATQMAKIFGKVVEPFTRNDATKRFISECLKSDNSRFLGITNESDLIDSRQKSGTWMHRVLALKFAAWLDPAFELWVYITIDKILNQYFREQRDAMIERVSLKARREQLRQELLLKYPEMVEYFDLEERERAAHYRRISAAREQFRQLRIEFTHVRG